MNRKGGQHDLGTSLGRLLNRLDRKSGGGYFQVRVQDAWREVAGAGVAAHTVKAHVRQGELIVYVDSPVWATELSALAEQYRVRMNEELGHEPVKSVRFTVSKRVAEERHWEQAQQDAEDEKSHDVVESVPLSDVERAQVEASAASIEDDELREAVIRATVADLEWKKGLSKRKDREEPRDGL